MDKRNEAKRELAIRLADLMTAWYKAMPVEERKPVIVKIDGQGVTVHEPEQS